MYKHTMVLQYTVRIMRDPIENFAHNLDFSTAKSHEAISVGLEKHEIIKENHC